VAWHESARLAEWFENQALAREGRLSEMALTLALGLKERVHPYGPVQLNRWEDRLLDRLIPGEEPARLDPSGPGPALVAPAGRPEPVTPAGLPPTPPWPDPAADPAAWLSQVNPDEYPPEAEPSLPETDPEEGGTMTETVPDSPLVFNKVLLLGDSMMLEGLGPQLQKELRRRHEKLTVVRDGRYGTGLTRLDHFDWLDFFDRMLVKYRPDLVILTIGANDPQDILDPEGPPGRRRILVSTDDWNELYAARVTGLLKLAEDRGIRVFWVGLPIMGRQPYGQRVAGINAVAASACAEAANCQFWDSWLSVADAQGRYVSYGLDEKGRRQRIRGRDFIHLTEEGGRVMARKFLDETADWAEYRGFDPDEPEPEAEQSTVEQPPAEQPAVEQQPVVPVEPPPLTNLGVPPLPPQPQPWPESPETGPPVPRAEPPEGEYDDYDVPLSVDDPVAGPGFDLDEDDFVDPLPVEDEPRLAPSAGDGAAENFGAAWSEGLFHSPALGRAAVWRMAIPGSGRIGPFPIIILLHGAWDSAAAWERELGREALLTLSEGLGVVLAMPESPPLGWYLDGRETAAATFLLRDFLPHIWRECPEADQGRVGLAGLSMGGHGALTLALQRPDLFQAVAALSAVTDLAAHIGGHKLDGELGLERALGPAGPDGRNWRPFGAAGLWPDRSAAWVGRPLFLGVGRSDRLTLEENRAFSRQLASLGVSHVYRERPGGHDWGYWAAELPEMLTFLAEALYHLYQAKSRIE